MNDNTAARAYLQLRNLELAQENRRLRRDLELAQADKAELKRVLAITLRDVGHSVLIRRGDNAAPEFLLSENLTGDLLVKLKF